MKKLIFTILSIALLSSCGMSIEKKKEKIQECKDLGLGWWYSDLFWETITCSHWGKKDETPFEKCANSCKNVSDEECLSTCLKINKK